jgi:hypothetical protein
MASSKLAKGIRVQRVHIGYKNCILKDLIFPTPKIKKPTTGHNYEPV